ncbi:hypothetical protein POSPLADRAFT_1041561 [Postia placenta MAD-698-R-SB12]|uniref:Mid2 domain-containing protein n=1 Tax=Postia placenta MAD-698-R-SB12 TaxID=670580 RepID=A0A1X6MMP4_9APHY|nr:hypothetical protein POSPLADRAFT_1041561 [Postia placenta MAD-698-R-SB12]OSX57598.1 hypothetical protein POSPLADRAFT_1041561 [Postia placenta MAD-698-R-SB12]
MLRSSALGRYLLLLALVSALVPLAAAHDSRPHHARSVARRDGITLFPPPPDTSTPANTNTDTSQSTQSSSSNSASSQSTHSSTAGADTSKSSNTATTSSGTSTTSSTASSTPPPSSQSTGSSTSTSTTSSQPSPTPPPSSTRAESSVLSTSVSTNSQGVAVTVIETVSASAPQSSQSSAGQANNSNSSSSGISTGGIIGLSVAGGVLLLSVIAFAVFKFSRKRYLDEYDDGDGIKWPELNTHGDNPHALPTNRTGGAGFETSSEVNLTRPDSRAGSIAPSAAASAVDLYPAQHDPYAVPPLPHLNPNIVGVQPYRDDPSAGYYDPYSGPVPHTLEGEAIPMTQIGGRARSPMPGGPGMGMGGRASPAPGFAPPMGMGGRASPAPGLAPPMNMQRSVSPGPGGAYGPGGYGV